MSTAIANCPAHKPAVSARLDEAARTLAADPKHIRMARKIAAIASARHGIPPDEADSAALLGLVDAARQYRPEQGVRFTTYAPRRIKGEIADMARNWRPGKRNEIDAYVGSIHDGVGMDPEAGTLTHLDVLASDDDAPEVAAESADLIEAMIRMLPPTWQPAMRLLYTRADVSTQAAAARALGMRESNASQIQIKSIAFLRDALADRGIHTRADLEDAS